MKIIIKIIKLLWCLSLIDVGYDGKIINVI